MMGTRVLLSLEDAGSAHASADAHGNDAIALLGAAEVVDEGRDLTRASAAQGVTESNRTTERVHLNGTLTKCAKNAQTFDMNSQVAG